MHLKETGTIKYRLNVNPLHHRSNSADIRPGYSFTGERVNRKSDDIEEPVLIVAEFTNNHLGDLFWLKKMVRLAKEAGADFVKVQKHDVDTFYTKEELNSHYDSPFGDTLGDYRHHVELDEAGFTFLDRICK